MSKFEWEREGRKIKIRQNPDNKNIVNNTALKPEAVNIKDEKENKKTEGDYSEILSPMVGIFSIKLSAESTPFVEKGVTVEKNQTIGIIEAMKDRKSVV